MGFGEAISTCFRKYVDFSGRARRSEYWWFELFGMLLQIPMQMVVWILVLVAVEPVLMQMDSRGNLPTSAFDDLTLAPLAIGATLVTIIGLGLFLPQLAVTVRRLHDTGRSGLWYLVTLVPFGSFVVLVFVILDSEPGPNAYGANPKAGDWQVAQPPSPAYVAQQPVHGGVPQPPAPGGTPQA